MAEKHLKECEKTKEFISVVDAAKDNSLIYDNGEILKEKGYQQDLDKIKHWGLIGRIILPDLKERKRMGIIKELTLAEGKAGEGNVLDELVFLVPRSSPIDLQNFSELLKTNSFYFPCGKSRKSNEYDRMICAFFIWKLIQKGKKFSYNIFSLLIGIDKFMPVGGESGTLSFYLALLSVYYRKPISLEVAATALLDVGNFSRFNCPWCFRERVEKNLEKNFSENKISSVGGLSLKVSVAIKSEIKKLILATEQKEEYEKNIPQEFKEKLKVYYVKDVEELEKLFWQGEFS